LFLLSSTSFHLFGVLSAFEGDVDVDVAGNVVLVLEYGDEEERVVILLLLLLFNCVRLFAFCT
jgi:hypothetical protein